MIENFYVAPLGGLDIGKRVNETITNITDKRRLESVKEEAALVFKTGDLNQIAEFMIRNPEMQEHIREVTKFKNDATEKNAIESNMKILEGEDPVSVAKERVEFLRKQGADTTQSMQFLAKLMENPENASEIAKKEAEASLALRAPQKFLAYKKATAIDSPDLTDDEREFIRYQNLKKTDPKAAKEFGTQIGIFSKDTKTANIKDFDHYLELKSQGKMGEAQQFAIQTGISNNKENRPYTTLAKLKEDFGNGFLTSDEYKQQADDILNPLKKTKAELTAAMLNGDKEAESILKEMFDAEVAVSQAKGYGTAAGKFEAIQKVMDVPGIADGIIEGREIIDNVKNTFGVPLQEMVRNEVLSRDPNFNFNQPRARYNSLKSSLMKQESRLGAMGSFVQNINGQVNKLKNLAEDISKIPRVGLRALDKPWRQWKKSFVGSGQEMVFEAFMKEISAEIQKLSMGAEASVGQLPETNRIEWEAIHDPNLSLPELIKVFEGTRDMANIRHNSVKEERDRTLQQLSNVRDTGYGYGGPPATTITGPDDPAYNQIPSGGTYIYEGKTYRKK